MTSRAEGQHVMVWNGREPVEERVGVAIPCFLVIDATA
jgi:hypothetical protein